jgi:hypothetical protein
MRKRFASRSSSVKPGSKEKTLESCGNQYSLRSAPMIISQERNNSSSSKRIATGTEGRGETGVGFPIFGDI